MMKPQNYPKLAAILASAVKKTSEQEIATWCQVTQAAVSYWISGYNRPRPAHIVILALHLRLDPHNLAEAAGYKPDDITRLFQDRFVLAHDLEYARANVKHIYDARTEGSSQIAIEMADEMKTWLKSFPALSQELLQIYARVSFEQSWAYKEISLHDKIRQTSNQIVAKMDELADVYHDPFIDGLARVCQGDTFYILKQYDNSINMLKNALDNDLVKEADDKLSLLRALGLSAAYQNEPRIFQKAEKKARALIDEGQCSSVEHTCQVLEGLGRAQGLLGDFAKSLATLDEAQQVLKKLEWEKKKAPLRAVQVARSKLTVIQHTEPHNLQAIEEAGIEAMRIAREYRYERHEKTIHELLDRTLNKKRP